MKQVAIPESDAAVNALLDRAREEELLVRAADGAGFLVRVLDDFDEEIIRTRENPALMALLDERFRQAERIPWEEVKRQLDLK